MQLTKCNVLQNESCASNDALSEKRILQNVSFNDELDGIYAC